jgi:hypothetical protein
VDEWLGFLLPSPTRHLPPLEQVPAPTCNPSRDRANHWRGLLTCVSGWTIRSYRPTFWEVEDKERLKERSLRRVRYLLGAVPKEEVEEEVRKRSGPRMNGKQ